MQGFCVFLGLVFVLNSASASYQGPFLLWGPNTLSDIKIPALGPIDETVLTKLYGNAKAIMIFIKSGTTRLDDENFPNFKEMVHNSSWFYTALDYLPVEPQSNNNNVEIVNLVGPVSQQDVETTSLYKDSVSIYGEGNVLAMLVNERLPHYIFKRDAEVAPESTTLSPSSSTTSATPTEEPMQEDFIYIAAEKAILYTTAAPVLETEVEEKAVAKELSIHGFVQFDARNNISRLIVSFTTDDDNKQSKTTLRFRFPISGGYWYLNSVEVEEKDFSDILFIEGEPPSAPIGFSYKCCSPLVFRNGTNSLKLQSIQVQPLLDGANKFSDAYHCVGFTTAPIWSGIFVSFIVLLGTAIGIIAILDIKTPNRFESSRSKQLTFTVQE